MIKQRKKLLQWPALLEMGVNQAFAVRSIQQNCRENAKWVYSRGSLEASRPFGNPAPRIEVLNVS